MDIKASVFTVITHTKRKVNINCLIPYMFQSSIAIEHYIEGIMKDSKDVLLVLFLIANVPEGHCCLLNMYVQLYRRLIYGKSSLNVKRMLHLSPQLFETSLSPINISDMRPGTHTCFHVKWSLDLSALNEN